MSGSRAVIPPLLAALCLVALTACPRTSGHCAGGFEYGDARLLYRLDAPEIDESSGVAPASRGSVIFTHNDSGDEPRFFAIGAGGKIVGTYHVAGAQARDWEDMAAAPGRDGKPALFLGDIGDNGAVRTSIVVYEVHEPDLSRSRATLPSIAYELRYPDGPHNAETLIVAPRTGRIVIVTKRSTGVNGVYATAGRPSPSGVNRLRRIATVSMTEVASDGGYGPSLQVTGGAITRDGSRLVLRTYAEAFEWSLPKGDIAAAFRKAPLKIEMPLTMQGEAITYARGGNALITTSEGAHAPVHRLDRRRRACG